MPQARRKIGQRHRGRTEVAKSATRGRWSNHRPKEPQRASPPCHMGTSSGLNHCPKSLSKLMSPSGLNIPSMVDASNVSNELATLWMKSFGNTVAISALRFPCPKFPCPRFACPMGVEFICEGTPRIAEGEGAIFCPCPGPGPCCCPSGLLGAGVGGPVPLAFGVCPELLGLLGG